MAACFWVAMAAAIGAGVRGDSPTALEIAFLAIPAVAGGLSMIAAGAVAVTAVRRGDRSLRLAVPIVLGALALLFAAGEVFAPH